MWAAGCILADAIFHTTYIFKDKNESGTMRRIAKFLGGQELVDYARERNIPAHFDPDLLTYIASGFRRLKSESCEETATDEAIDLVEKLLVYDQKKRLTAKEALDHPYFSGVHPKLQDDGEINGNAVKNLIKSMKRQLNLTEESPLRIEVNESIGQGSFGVLFKSKIVGASQTYAVKFPTVEYMRGYSMKIKILETLKGCPSINKLLGSVAWIPVSGIISTKAEFNNLHV